MRQNAGAARKAGPVERDSLAGRKRHGRARRLLQRRAVLVARPREIPKGPTSVKTAGREIRDAFRANRRDLGEMCFRAILALAMAAYLLGYRACGTLATRVLSTWFLDPWFLEFRTLA